MPKCQRLDVWRRIDPAHAGDLLKTVKERYGNRAIPTILEIEAGSSATGEEEGRTMDDQKLVERINELARDEHALWERESRGEASKGDAERLKEIAVTLDQCWDLLHQRRARRAAGMDPDEATVRDRGTVEGYLG